VNGQKLIGIYGDRQMIIDDGVSKRLTLESQRDPSRNGSTPEARQ
jgi:hypothetical protein